MLKVPALVIYLMFPPMGVRVYVPEEMTPSLVAVVVMLPPAAIELAPLTAIGTV
jgi:hypothetical protein